MTFWKNINATQERFRGCLLGLATGDAVGTTNEFTHREDLVEITDMVGGGPFQLKPGEWTDDTSMALCLAKSLIDRGCFDPVDQQQKYLSWFRRGYMSSNGVCFDIGNTVRTALEYFEMTGEALAGSTDPNTAGNGSIMRLAPVPMFYFPDLKKMCHYAALSSKTTHGAPEAVESCELMTILINRALSGATKEAILAPVDHPFKQAKLQRLAEMQFLQKPKDDIKSSGYVIDSLEAAIWCFAQTETFQAAVLLAANLGDDADTVAAIGGQIAGAYYGATGIPSTWRQRLVRSGDIIRIADKLYKMASSGKFH